jgi:N-dimethylarginine dimethylaminohydrolase
VNELGAKGDDNEFTIDCTKEFFQMNHLQMNHVNSPQSNDVPAEIQALSWGRSYLMCPPDYFGVLYEINPWMHTENAADRDLAQEQWHYLVANLRRAGATVKTMEPVKSLPDLVFTANAGLVNGPCFIPSKFTYPERQPEVIYNNAWFRSHDFEIIEFSRDPQFYFEGCGDAFMVGGHLVAGYGFRTELAAHAVLARKLGVGYHSIKLVDARLYHLDMSFCPLDDRHALIVPDVWDRKSCEGLEQLIPEPLVLELDEALTFCANSVVVGKTIIMPHCPPRVGRILHKWGYEVSVSPVTEFIKAGGGVRCLTLALDVSYQNGG